MSRRTRRLNIPILMTTVLGGGSATTPLQEAQALIDGIGSTIKRAWFTHLGTLNQASDGTGDPAIANGDPVGRIPDLSTADDPAIQSSATLRGLYRPTGVNGFPGVEITVDDVYTFTSLTLTNFTIFAVVDLDTTATVANYILGGFGSGMFIGGSAVSGWGVIGSGGDRQANEKLTTPEIYVATNSQLWKNGVEATYTSTGTLTGMSQLNRIGYRTDNTLRLNGKFGAIIIADTQLSDADKNAIGSYLAGVYGKTWTDINP